MYKHHTREEGQYAEGLALQYLSRQGLTLIERNYDVHDMGEIDLIMRTPTHIVFVEVRARADFSHVHPFETVTKAKQHRIITTARHFLHMHKQYQLLDGRFDVVAVNLSTQAIEWLDHAFY